MNNDNNEINEIVKILHEYFQLSGNSEIAIDYLNCAQEILNTIKKKEY